jgi:hypothetical protein
MGLKKKVNAPIRNIPTALGLFCGKTLNSAREFQSLAPKASKQKTAIAKK